MYLNNAGFIPYFKTLIKYCYTAINLCCWAYGSTFVESKMLIIYSKGETCF